MICSPDTSKESGTGVAVSTCLSPIHFFFSGKNIFYLSPLTFLLTKVQLSPANCQRPFQLFYSYPQPKLEKSGTHMIHYVYRDIHSVSCATPLIGVFSFFTPPF